MSKLLEFFLGSILVAAFTVALMFFSALQYVLRVSSVADCAWQGSAKAWVDSNGDGQVDYDESPFGDVTVHVEDVENRLVPAEAAGWVALTDKDGDVRFNILIPECVNTVFAIYADIPEGYRLTTRPHIEVNSSAWEGLGTEHVYYFGFVADP